LLEGLADVSNKPRLYWHEKRGGIMEYTGNEKLVADLKDLLKSAEAFKFDDFKTDLPCRRRQAPRRRRGV